MQVILEGTCFWSCLLEWLQISWQYDCSLPIWLAGPVSDRVFFIVSYQKKGAGAKKSAQKMFVLPMKQKMNVF